MSLIKKKVASVSSGSKTYPVQVASMDAELQFVIEVSKEKKYIKHTILIFILLFLVKTAVLLYI